ncbi:S46 family peptidase [Mesorhizobium sp. M1340]|uniref:hypothetical protein n=1 Tax=Mesorhizobium sp. M1340 TaxID=2957087 RepID=UPI003334D171
MKQDESDSQHEREFEMFGQSNCHRLALDGHAISADEGMWMPGQTAEVGAAMRADGPQIEARN